MGKSQATCIRITQNRSGVLTEAIKEYVNRRRVRPFVLDELEHSIQENDLIQFLSSDEAVAIHAHLIEKFGGANLSLLESALYHPQQGFRNTAF